MKVAITSGVQEQLLKAAASAAPEECCGLLLGRPGHIEAAVPAKNVAADRTRSFEIDPATLLRTHREARGGGQQVIGHYHSHPNGRAEPSKRDAARAVEDGQLWVIIANNALTAWTTQLPPPCGEGDSASAERGGGSSRATPTSLNASVESPSPPSPEATSGRRGGTLHNRFTPIPLEPA